MGTTWEQIMAKRNQSSQERTASRVQAKKEAQALKKDKEAARREKKLKSVAGQPKVAKKMKASRPAQSGR